MQQIRETKQVSPMASLRFRFDFTVNRVTFFFYAANTLFLSILLLDSRLKLEKSC